MSDQEAFREYEKTRDPRIRERIVLSHSKLIRSICIAVRHRTPSSDDLHNGMIGLLEAFDSFDPLRGVEFSTYAYSRIRNAVQQGEAHEKGQPRRLSRGQMRTSAGDANDHLCALTANGDRAFSAYAEGDGRESLTAYEDPASERALAIHDLLPLIERSNMDRRDVQALEAYVTGESSSNIAILLRCRVGDVAQVIRGLLARLEKA